MTFVAVAQQDRTVVCVCVCVTVYMGIFSAVRLAYKYPFVCFIGNVTIVSIFTTARISFRILKLTMISFPLFALLITHSKLFDLREPP